MFIVNITTFKLLHSKSLNNETGKCYRDSHHIIRNNRNGSEQKPN